MIKTQEQADAARGYIEAKERWHNLMGQDRPELTQIRAALAVWNAKSEEGDFVELERKISLYNKFYVYATRGRDIQLP